MPALAGCTALPGSNGVVTLKQTHINISWKITAYEAAQTGGSVTAEQAQAVAAAQLAYQQAFQQALADAGGDLDTVTPPSLQAAATRLLIAINNVLTTLT